MASLVKVFFAFLVVLFLSGQGYAQCSLSSVSTEVVKTERVVKGIPELEVVISNKCICTQSDLVVSCDGFNAFGQLKPEVIRKVEGGCLVNDGNPIYGLHEPFKFNYFGEPTKFIPISSEVSCSG